jgi:hypothetical protein
VSSLKVEVHYWQAVPMPVQLYLRIGKGYGWRGSNISFTIHTIHEHEVSKLEATLQDEYSASAGRSLRSLSDPFAVSYRQLGEATAAMADPKVRTVYEKRAVKQHRRPFHRELSDYFKGNNLLSRK